MKTRSIILAPLLALLAGCVTSSGPTQAPVATRPAPAPRQVTKARPVAPSFLPRVMVIVDEKSLGTIATAEVEAMAIKKLLAQNVPVVDQDMVRANIASSQQMLIAAGDNRGAAALGTQFGAAPRLRRCHGGRPEDAPSGSAKACVALAKRHWTPVARHAVQGTPGSAAPSADALSTELTVGGDQP